TAAGGFNNIGFQLTDGPDTIFRNVSLNVAAVQITTTGVLPNVTLGSPYSTPLAASGGSGTYTFSGNNLPFGLTLSSAGVISGTVNSGSGRFSLQITVRDANNSSLSYTKNMSIDVIGSAPTLPGVGVFNAGLDD